MSMIILLIVMVSVSFTSNEENLISNMEGQEPGPGQQVRREELILSSFKNGKFKSLILE